MGLDLDGLDGALVNELELPSVIIDIDSVMLADGPTVVDPPTPRPLPILHSMPTLKHRIDPTEHLPRNRAPARPVPKRHGWRWAAVFIAGAASAVLVAYHWIGLEVVPSPLRPRVVAVTQPEISPVGGGPLEELPAPQADPPAPIVTPIDPAVTFPGGFGFNAEAPSPLEEAELATFVDQLRARCGEAGVVVTGHTCNTGTRAMNRTVGLDRARAVERLLRAHGLEHVRATSAGASRPIASNRTVEGRRANRRVTLSCDLDPEKRR